MNTIAHEGKCIVNFYTIVDGMRVACQPFQDKTGITVWKCAKCRRGNVGFAASGESAALEKCRVCHREIIREILPMTADLFRMRTNRNDAVEF